MGNPLDARPIIVAIAGPNGAGKSTFYEAFLQQTGLRFINADNIARELGIDAYEASELAERLRKRSSLSKRALCSRPCSRTRWVRRSSS